MGPTFIHVSHQFGPDRFDSMLDSLHVSRSLLHVPAAQIPAEDQPAVTVRTVPDPSPPSLPLPTPHPPVLTGKVCFFKFASFILD